VSEIRFAAAELMSRLTADEPFRTVLEHGDASAVIYAPKEIDRQSAHGQAEIYVVISGRGRLRVGWQDIAFTAGDLLYVDAGIKHRFEDFSADLAVWAVFFGPSILGKHTFQQGAFSGAVTISQDKDTFLAKWSGTGGAGLAGVGFARPGHIAFARTPDNVAGWPGFVEYRWDNDHLMARWTLPTALQGAIAGGRATLLEGDGPGFAGRFRIQYQDASGADLQPPYDLRITGSGLVRSLEWQTSGTTALVGIGLVVDHVLVAAWAPPNVSGMEVVDYELPGQGAPASMPGRYVRFGASGSEDEHITLVAAV
jgi:hypothetical protein